MSKQGEEEYRPPEGDEFQSESTQSGDSPIGDFKSEPLVTEARKPASKPANGVEGLMAKKWFAPVFLIVGFFVVLGYLKYFKAPPANSKLDSSSAGDVIVPAGTSGSKSMSALSALSSINKSGATAPSSPSTTMPTLGAKAESLNTPAVSTTPALGSKTESLNTPVDSSTSTTMPTLGVKSDAVTKSTVGTTPAAPSISTPTLSAQTATSNNAIASTTSSSAPITMPILGSKADVKDNPSVSTTPAAMANTTATIISTPVTTMKPTVDAKTDAQNKATDSSGSVVNSVIPTNGAKVPPVTKPILIATQPASATNGKPVATSAAISLSKSANGKAAIQSDDSYQIPPSGGNNSIFSGLAPASPTTVNAGASTPPPKNKQTLATTTSAATTTSSAETIPGCNIIPGTTGHAGERTVSGSSSSPAAITVPVLGGSDTDNRVNALQSQIKDLHDNIRVITGSMEVVSKQMKNMTEQLRSHTTQPITKESSLKQAMKSNDQNVLSEALALDMPTKERVSTLLFLKAAIPGRAWIRTAAGDTDTVTVGDFIHGYGKVTEINEVDGKVVLSTGIVIKYGPGDR